MSVLNKEAEELHNTFWDRYLGAYDRIYSHISAYQQVLDFTAERLAGAHTILDCGAGTGFLARVLLEQGKDVTALDQNEVALRMLKEKTNGKNEHLKVVAGDVRQLPFKDSEFDGAACLHVLPFIKDPSLCIKELARVLAPEGVLVVSGPSEGAKDFEYVGGKLKQELKDKNVFKDLEGDWDFISGKVHEILDGQHMFNWFSKEEIEQLLVEAGGFTITEHQPNPIYQGLGYLIAAQK